jgi:hypothetical protein
MHYGKGYARSLLVAIKRDEKMEFWAKVTITVWMVIIDLFLAYPLVIYHQRKEEIKKRYWGKNRTWLEDTIAAIWGKIIFATGLAILIWFI